MSERGRIVKIGLDSCFVKLLVDLDRPSRLCHRDGVRGNHACTGDNRDEEIAVHYTFGVVRVIGHHLEAIYSLLKQHNLDFARLSDAHDPCRDEIEVTRIVFENISADAGGSEL